MDVLLLHPSTFTGSISVQKCPFLARVFDKNRGFLPLAVNGLNIQRLSSIPNYVNNIGTVIRQTFVVRTYFTLTTLYSSRIYCGD